MRVLHLTRDFPPCANGGISTAVGNLVARLSIRNTESFVISFDAWKPKSKALDTRHRAGKVAPASASAPWIFRLHDRSQIESARKFATDSGAQMLHVHDALLWDEAKAMAEMLKAGTLYTVHVYHKAMNQVRGLTSTSGSKAEKDAFENASLISVACTSMKNLLVKDFPWLRRKLREASWGVDSVDEHDDHRTKEVIYAGRFSDIKGTHRLRKIIFQVLDMVPNARFLLAGGVPLNSKAEKKWVRSITQDLDRAVLDRLEIPGWLDADGLYNRLNKTWVMTSPSKFETFGLSVLEAMSHSVPVVASTTPGVESMLLHGKTGYLVEQHDSDSMVKHLVKILSSDRLRDDLGRAGRKLVKKSMLWEYRIVQWLKIYDELTLKSPCY